MKTCAGVGPKFDNICSARLEEREASVAEAKRKVEQQERQARELEAEQERQVWQFCP